MADQQVGFGPRRRRRQTLHELQRLEDQLSRPVAPGHLQLERDAAVVPEPQALLREGRPQYVPAQTLQPGAVIGRHPHVGVEIGPVQLGLPRPWRPHGLRVGLLPEAPHAPASARAQRHAPLDRGADDPRQQRSVLGEPIHRPGRVVLGFQAPAPQQPPDAVADQREHRRHVVVARRRRRVKLEPVRARV
jgi:hypothetical protein